MRSDADLERHRQHQRDIGEVLATRDEHFDRLDRLDRLWQLSVRQHATPDLPRTATTPTPPTRDAGRAGGVGGGGGGDQGSGGGGDQGGGGDRDGELRYGAVVRVVLGLVMLGELADAALDFALVHKLETELGESTIAALLGVSTAFALAIGAAGKLVVARALGLTPSRRSAGVIGTSTATPTAIALLLCAVEVSGFCTASATTIYAYASIQAAFNPNDPVDTANVATTAARGGVVILSLLWALWLVARDAGVSGTSNWHELTCRGDGGVAGGGCCLGAVSAWAVVVFTAMPCVLVGFLLCVLLLPVAGAGHHGDHGRAAEDEDVNSMSNVVLAVYAISMFFGLLAGLAVLNERGTVRQMFAKPISPPMPRRISVAAAITAQAAAVLHRSTIRSPVSSPPAATTVRSDTDTGQQQRSTLRSTRVHPDHDAWTLMEPEVGRRSVPDRVFGDHGADDDVVAPAFGVPERSRRGSGANGISASLQVPSAGGAQSGALNQGVSNGAATVEFDADSDVADVRGTTRDRHSRQHRRSTSGQSAPSAHIGLDQPRRGSEATEHNAVTLVQPVTHQEKPSRGSDTSTSSLQVPSATATRAVPSRGGMSQSDGTSEYYTEDSVMLSDAGNDVSVASNLYSYMSYASAGLYSMEPTGVIPNRAAQAGPPTARADLPAGAPSPRESERGFGAATAEYSRRHRRRSTATQHELLNPQGQGTAPTQRRRRRSSSHTLEATFVDVSAPQQHEATTRSTGGDGVPVYGAAAVEQSLERRRQHRRSPQTQQRELMSRSIGGDGLSVSGAAAAEESPERRRHRRRSTASEQHTPVAPQHELNNVQRQDTPPTQHRRRRSFSHTPEATV